MRAIALAAAMMGALAGPASAWGPDGHSIVAEIAQRRLSGPAAQLVEKLLKGRSLASIASWADDYRASHLETTNRHFVDIPLDVAIYDAARDCKPDNQNGDCIIAGMTRVQQDLRCATGEAQEQALKFAVHLVNDIHQPLPSVKEKKGGNEIAIDLFMRGLATCRSCAATHTPVTYRIAWDVTLIQRTVRDWGAYVNRPENGWLKTSEAKAEDPAANQAAMTKEPLSPGRRTAIRSRRRRGTGCLPTMAICATCCRSWTGSSALPACAWPDF